MFSRRVVSVFAALLAAVSLAALTGCEWFQGSDPVQRSSPMISNLSIQPSSVLCAQEFTVSFHFEDPQGDIAKAQVILELTGAPEPKPRLEETPLWPETISRSSGTASFPFSFTPKPCTDLGGTWTITVQVEDDRGHTSNTLAGQITLTTAG